MRLTLKDGGQAAVRQYRCVAIRSAALSPINGASVIPLDAIVTDPLGMLNSAGSLIIPQRGIWDAIAMLTWAVNATGVRRTWLTVNGSTAVLPLMELATIAGDGLPVPVSCPPTIFNAGDVIALNGYQSSGAGLALATGIANTFVSLSMRQAL